MIVSLHLIKTRERVASLRKPARSAYDRAVCSGNEPRELEVLPFKFEQSQFFIEPTDW